MTKPSSRRRGVFGSFLRLPAWLGALLILGVGLSYGIARAQTRGPVYLVSISNTIDLGLAPFLSRVLDQAAHNNAAAVIVEINTPGGRLDAVLQMRDTLLDSPVRTIAYVNREAFSAGALVALAADELYMAPGAVMGAATPVDGGGEPADAKTISAVRSVFRATAEVRERDPLIAEAMVDPTIVIDGLVSDAQLLTLTTDQAQQVGYTDGVVANRAELLEATGLTAATIVAPQLSLAETVVRFLTNPVIASLLISIGFLLILADLLTGGFGALGGVGVLLFVLFFWGHFLVGLAGWEGVALVVLGLALIALEVFVIPGFGIAGVVGGIALLGGLFISLIGGEIITTADLQRAGYTVLGMLLLMAGGGVLLLRFLPRAASLHGLILQSQVGVLDARQSQSAPRRSNWLEGDRLEAQSAANARPPETGAARLLQGASGVALSDLRPSGVAQIAGERVDVVTRGDYIRAGEPIEVISDEGYRRVVRRAVEQTNRPV